MCEQKPPPLSVGFTCALEHHVRGQKPFVEKNVLRSFALGRLSQLSERNNISARDGRRGMARLEISYLNYE